MLRIILPASVHIIPHFAQYADGKIPLVAGRKMLVKAIITYLRRSLYFIQQYREVFLYLFKYRIEHFHRSSFLVLVQQCIVWVIFIAIQLRLLALHLYHLCERWSKHTVVILLPRGYPCIKAFAGQHRQFIYKFRRQLLILLQVFHAPLHIPLLFFIEAFCL